METPLDRVGLCTGGESLNALPRETTKGPVAVMVPAESGVVVLGPNDAWRCHGTTCTRIPDRMSRNYRDAAVGPDGTLWVATGMGLYNLRPEGMRHYYREDELVSGQINGIAFAADGRLWAGVTRWRNRGRSLPPPVKRGTLQRRTR